MKLKPTTVDHVAFRDELVVLMDKYAGKLDASDLLALCAHTTGQILAMQDPLTMTSEMAMKIVTTNLEAGNAQAVADVENWLGKPS